MKVSMSLNTEEWWAFRKACLERRTPASQEISRLIREQLAQWKDGSVAERDARQMEFFGASAAEEVSCSQPLP